MSYTHNLLGNVGLFTTAFVEYKQLGFIIKICNEVDELVFSSKLTEDNAVAFLTNSAPSVIDFDSRYQLIRVMQRVG